MATDSVPGPGHGGNGGPERITPATADRPCPVCGGDHKCGAGDGGLVLCGRRDGPVPGFRHLGPARGDPQFHLYRAGEGRAERTRPQAGGHDWPARAREYARHFTPEARAELADRLRLPPEVFDALPDIGVEGVGPAGRTFTLPECDAAGAVVGLARRFPDGGKRHLPGGKRGLTLPAGWADRPGPVHLPEGPSDALALTAAGLAAVGRPSNTGGVRHLAALLAGLDPARAVVVLGENDRKGDGTWPGRDGAERTARVLTRGLGRPVGWALPPPDAKDARDWLTARVTAGESWEAAGAAFGAALVVPAADPAGGTTSAAVIEVTVREYEVNDRAAAALAAEPDLYQRGGALVRVVAGAATAARSIHRPAGPRIDALPAASLRERLTRRADWVRVRETKDGEVVTPVHPPDWCVQAVHARGDWPAVRPLEAVVEYPVLLPDGRVLTDPGYDPDTGLLYAPPPGLAVDLPDRPTRADARAAAAALLEVVADFPFEAPAHRAAWVAAVLTPLARWAFPGPAPLFLADGNVRGVGKGLLLHAVSRIVAGEPFTVATYAHDADELRKRITALALEGDRLVLFDNLDGQFGNAALDAALTATAWKDRLLGHNRQVRVPLWACWYATGNNVRVGADTARRVCHLRLETPAESPEGRSDFRHPDLLGWVGDNRPRLLAAALTVLRGYVAAGRPVMALPAWGSFEGWSGLVRAAVVWAGLPDPGDTRRGLREAADVAAGAMAALLAGWDTIDPTGTGLTAAQVVDRVYGKPPHPGTDGLRDALDGLLAKPDGRLLGYKFRHYRRRVFGGRFLDLAGGSGGTNRWAAYPADRFRRPDDAPPAAGDDSVAEPTVRYEEF